MHLVCFFLLLLYYDKILIYLYVRIINGGGESVKILYIDVYFLINFTVDLLSLYFAALFSKTKSTVRRLIVAAAIGAAFACIAALTNIPKMIYIPFLLISGVFVCFVFSGKITLLRGFKLFFAFLIFETLIGGAVSFVYGFLDTKLYPLLEENDVFNRRLLTLAIAVLFAIGIIKLCFFLFSGSKNEKSMTIIISIGDKMQRIDALVDSGNLLRDPISGQPVIIVKRKSFKLISDNIDPLNSNDKEIQKRIRLIPVKTVSGGGMLVGLRTDKIETEDKREINNAIIALDNEEGNFGGYGAIISDAVFGD